MHCTAIIGISDTAAETFLLEISSDTMDYHLSADPFTLMLHSRHPNPYRIVDTVGERMSFVDSLKPRLNSLEESFRYTNGIAGCRKDGSGRDGQWKGYHGASLLHRNINPVSKVSSSTDAKAKELGNVNPSLTHMKRSSRGHQ
jgi:hypothetical protein